MGRQGDQLSWLAQIGVVSMKRILEHPIGTGLLIVDDFFPNVLSGFRVAEFNHYLRVFPGLKIVCTNGLFNEYSDVYGDFYPDLVGRLEFYSSASFDYAKTVYCIFLNNAYYFLPELERRRIPFSFTLYPGGGFELNDDVASRKLSRVLASPMLCSVIATQPITLDVLRRLRCRADLVYIPGGVVNPTYLALPDRASPPSHVREIRICFAAYKYEERGISKGYPEFLAAAALIAGRHANVIFNVIGNFSEHDVVPDPVLKDRLSFLGPLQTMALQECFLRQDIMVAPSRRHAVTGTAFDGFPTGTCVEAALCGVALICSDELDQNRYYKDGEDIFICKPEIEEITGCIEMLLLDPSLLLNMQRKVRSKTRTLYGAGSQLLPRSQVLRKLSRRCGGADW